MQISLLGSFACQFCYASHRFTLMLTFLDFIFHNFCNIRMNMHEVIYILFYKIAYEFVNAFAIRRHLCRTKFNLCLALKHGFVNVECYRCDNTVTNIGIFIVLIEKLLYRFRNMFLKSTLMSSALCSMLTIDKTMILLTILISMCKCYLYILTNNMNNRVKSIISHVVIQQIFKTVTTFYSSSVVHDCKSTIQVGIVT